ncbi:extensin family protein [Rhizobium sp. C1]|uniref:extensin family protein n=1 Tax=Rhizobium sp. C1 TaxID=1349799 RepID=UPI001E527576|nr:extensin family protein [Rhizobium sp. C1]MCD2180360.1 extensin family protein [Rhizobium sp. C1]
MVQGRIILLALAFASLNGLAAKAAPPALPTEVPLPGDKVPVPETRPDTAPASPPIPEEKPKERPDAASETKTPVPATTPEDKKDSPKSEDKPKAPEEDTGPAKPEPEKAGEPKDRSDKNSETKEAPTEPKAEVPPVEKEDPEAYAACLSRLKDAGIDFSEAKPIDDGNGCGIDKPLTVRSVLPGIKLEPEATMRCETAEALTRWTKAIVIPSAELAFGPKASPIVQVNQATSYACRNRNHAESGKISEHAHGNAIDIAGFTFSDGKTFVIEPREKDSTLTGAFERAITASACLFFTTVLGPGSDAAHETHLHLDVIKRKGDFRYCW